MSAACPRFGFVVERSGPDDSFGELLPGLEQAAAARGLEVSSIGSHLVFSSEASQATNADRQFVRHWLESRVGRSRFEVGPIIDLGEG